MIPRPLRPKLLRRLMELLKLKLLKKSQLTSLDKKRSLRITLKRRRKTSKRLMLKPTLRS
jgi:hypothetical protein